MLNFTLTQGLGLRSVAFSMSPVSLSKQALTAIFSLTLVLACASGYGPAATASQFEQWRPVRPELALSGINSVVRTNGLTVAVERTASQGGSPAWRLDWANSLLWDTDLPRVGPIAQLEPIAGDFAGNCHEPLL